MTSFGICDSLDILGWSWIGAFVRGEQIIDPVFCTVVGGILQYCDQMDGFVTVYCKNAVEDAER